MRFSTVVKSIALSAALALSAGSAMAELSLTGSGATFPQPLYTTWFKTFSRVHKDVQINYQGKGSGGGIRDLQDHTVDFAASDAAMSDKEMAVVKEGVILLPMTAGEIVLSYNLEGVKNLKLSRDAYTGIFLGKVKKWNDPAIAKTNPGVKLPDEEITVVARADASGTNFVFTKHLSAISPEFAKAPGFGKTVDWPSAVKLIKAPKNDGVTATIKQTPGAIGYIEYGFAVNAKVPMAELQNKTGAYVAPGLAGGQAALAGGEFPPDMRLWLSDPTGAKAYPIATYTWMLFYKHYADAAKGKALKSMINYCLDEGQKISDKAGYIPLPPSVVTKVKKAAENITF